MFHDNNSSKLLSWNTFVFPLTCISSLNSPGYAAKKVKRSWRPGSRSSLVPFVSKRMTWRRTSIAGRVEAALLQDGIAAGTDFPRPSICLRGADGQLVGAVSDTAPCGERSVVTRDLRVCSACTRGLGLACSSARYRLSSALMENRL